MGEKDFSGLPRLTPRETLAWASRARSVSAYADPGAPVAEDVLAGVAAAAGAAGTAGPRPAYAETERTRLAHARVTRGVNRGKPLKSLSPMASLWVASAARNL